MLICPKEFFNDEAKIKPRARKMQQNGNNCHAAIALHHLSSIDNKNPNQFLFLVIDAVQTVWPYH